MKLLPLALLLTLLSLASHAGKKASKQASSDDYDPCFLSGKLMTDSYVTNFTKAIAHINLLETSPSRRGWPEALDMRRTIQMANPECYKWMQSDLGLGRSPLTGE